MNKAVKTKSTETEETKMAEMRGYQGPTHNWRIIIWFLGASDIDRELNRRIRSAISSTEDDQIVAIGFEQNEAEGNALFERLLKIIDNIRAIPDSMLFTIFAEPMTKTLRKNKGFAHI